MDVKERKEETEEGAAYAQEKAKWLSRRGIIKRGLLATWDVLWLSQDSHVPSQVSHVRPEQVEGHHRVTQNGCVGLSRVDNCR